MEGIKHQRAGISEGPQSPKKYSGILETMGKWLGGWQKSAHRHSGISRASRGAEHSGALASWPSIQETWVPADAFVA